MKKHDCNFFYGKTIETNLRDGGAQRINYCPICGRLLDLDNEALTLEELFDLLGESVYVVCEEFPLLNGLYIVSLDEQVGRIQCWGCEGVRMDSCNYGTWLAYRRQP